MYSETTAQAFVESEPDSELHAEVRALLKLEEFEGLFQKQSPTKYNITFDQNGNPSESEGSELNGIIEVLRWVRPADIAQAFNEGNPSRYHNLIESQVGGFPVPYKQTEITKGIHPSAATEILTRSSNAEAHIAIGLNLLNRLYNYQHPTTFNYGKKCYKTFEEMTPEEQVSERQAYFAARYAFILMPIFEAYDIPLLQVALEDQAFRILDRVGYEECKILWEKYYVSRLSINEQIKVILEARKYIEENTQLQAGDFLIKARQKSLLSWISKARQGYLPNQKNPRKKLRDPFAASVIITRQGMRKLIKTNPEEPYLYSFREEAALAALERVGEIDGIEILGNYGTGEIENTYRNKRKGSLNFITLKTEANLSFLGKLGFPEALCQNCELRVTTEFDHLATKASREDYKTKFSKTEEGLRRHLNAKDPEIIILPVLAAQHLARARGKIRERFLIDNIKVNNPWFSGIIKDYKDLVEQRKNYVAVVTLGGNHIIRIDPTKGLQLAVREFALIVKPNIASGELSFKILRDGEFVVNHELPGFELNDGDRIILDNPNQMTISQALERLSDWHMLNPGQQQDLYIELVRNFPMATKNELHNLINMIWKAKSKSAAGDAKGAKRIEKKVKAKVRTILVPPYYTSQARKAYRENQEVQRNLDLVILENPNYIRRLFRIKTPHNADGSTTQQFIEDVNMLISRHRLNQHVIDEIVSYLTEVTTSAKTEHRQKIEEAIGRAKAIQDQARILVAEMEA